MSQQNRQADVKWFSAAGAEVVGGAFVNGTTYYGEIGGAAGLLESITFKYDAVFAGTFTIESTNLDFDDKDASADFFGGARPFEAQADGWGLEAALGSVVVAAGAKNVQNLHIQGLGTKRARIKLVCSGTGKGRARPHHKS